MNATFALGAMAKLDEGARSARLRELEAEAAARLHSAALASEFFAESRRIIDELRTLGHDLWSFDSDGEVFEIWCGDWSRPGGGGPLSVEFRYPAEVEASWREAESSAG